MKSRVMVMHIENFTKPLYQVVLIDILCINWLLILSYSEGNFVFWKCPSIKYLTGATAECQMPLSATGMYNGYELQTEHQIAEEIK